MPRVRRAGRGAALAELLVALTLATLVSAAAAAVMVGAERYLGTSSDISEGRRVLREAESTLAAELRAAAADSVRVLGDTAAAFLGLVGTSVACVTAPGELVLPPATASATPPFTVWRVNPAPGDLVVAFDSAAAGTWRTAIVDSVSMRADGAGCTPASGFLSPPDSASHFPATRIVLSPALAGGVGIGAPVRLLRWGRYVLTRGGDRSWSLSYRSCDDALICGPSQPVAGPLAAASDTGLAFSVDGPAARLRVELRTAPRGRGASPERRRLDLALRNHVAGAP
jgi:hypothetical protein